MTDIPMPSNLRAAGKALWRTSLEENEFANHELSILEGACRTLDSIRALDAAVRKDGVMIASSQGSRLHPAIAEARQQRLALARMLVTLAIPGLDDGGPPHRTARPVQPVHPGSHGGW